jgi:hypothetical protein
MNNSSDILRNWFQVMTGQFSWLSIKYEYLPKDKIHYIAVHPYERVGNDEKYCIKENDIYDFLSKEYPDETFLFGSEKYNFCPLKNPEIFAHIEKEPVNRSFKTTEFVSILTE